MTHDTYDFHAALAASEAQAGQDIVSHVYEHYYAPRGFMVEQVEPVPKALQKDVVDYSVSLLCTDTGEIIERLCELKTEKHDARNISVERWNSLERGTEGWTFKPTRFHTQELLTVWRCGTVFLNYFEAYKNWLCAGPLPFFDKERLTSKLIPKKAHWLPSGYGQVHLENPGYTTEVILVPVDELREAFGKHSFYRLEGPWLSLAQDYIDAITKANEGGGKP